jgi:probable HAF family extracellular repeat protein
MSRTQALAACALTLAVSATLTNDAFAQSCPTPSTYELTDLGTLGGNYSAALDINAAGQIVGSSALADNSRQPFLWENGHMIALGTFGGTLGSTQTINASGQVAGQSFDASGQRRPFLWSDGVMQDLGISNGSAKGVTDSGDVVGWAYGSGSYMRAWLYRNGSVTDLGTLGGSSSGTNAINNSGQIVGWSYTAEAPWFHAVIWNAGSMTPVPTLGGTYSNVYGQNELGHVVGWSNVAGDASSHGYLYADGVLTEMGTLGGANSLASGISDSGEIVGRAQVADGTDHAAKWVGGVAQDLNNLIPAGSGWELQYAAGVNDFGKIVGWGQVGGERHGFLLTPSPSGMIGRVIALVQGFGLDHGTENSLLAKLQNAQSSTDGCDPNTACGNLGAFINAVEAQSGKSLTVEQANELIAGAQQVRAALGC